MIRGAVKGCCCSIAFAAALAIVLVAWLNLHADSPALKRAAEEQKYAASYAGIVDAYSKRMDAIRNEPSVRQAVTSIQKQTDHVRELKQIVIAQQECEKQLQQIHPPEELKDFHRASVQYMQQKTAALTKLLEEVKHKDVPELSARLKTIEGATHKATQAVDQALRSTRGYDEGKRKIQDVWSRMKTEMGKVSQDG